MQMSIGEVKSKRGAIHNYLGMKLDYNTPIVLKVDMPDYIKSMLEEFPQTEIVFKVDESSKPLGQERMKGISFCI